MWTQPQITLLMARREECDPLVSVVEEFRDLVHERNLKPECVTTSRATVTTRKAPGDQGI